MPGCEFLFKGCGKYFPKLLFKALDVWSCWGSEKNAPRLSALTSWEGLVLTSEFRSFWHCLPPGRSILWWFWFVCFYFANFFQEADRIYLQSTTLFCLLDISSTGNDQYWLGRRLRSAGTPWQTFSYTFLQPVLMPGGFWVRILYVSQFHWVSLKIIAYFPNTCLHSSCSPFLNLVQQAEKPAPAISPLHINESGCLVLYNLFVVGSFSQPWEFCPPPHPQPPPQSHWSLPSFAHIFLNRWQELTLGPEKKAVADWRW